METLATFRRNSGGPPNRYASLNFKHQVSFEQYSEWSKQVNYDSSRGKKAMPTNLRRAILDKLKKQFKLTAAQFKMVKDPINALLRHQRTVGWSHPNEEEFMD
ncbi:hypothetical protein FKM82_007537 [Ascaphus truei]